MGAACHKGRRAAPSGPVRASRIERWALLVTPDDRLASGKRHDRGHEMSAFAGVEDGGFSVMDDRHQAVRRPQIESDYF